MTETLSHSHSAPFPPFSISPYLLPKINFSHSFAIMYTSNILCVLNECRKILLKIYIHTIRRDLYLSNQFPSSPSRFLHFLYLSLPLFSFQHFLILGGRARNFSHFHEIPFRVLRTTRTDSFSPKNRKWKRIKFFIRLIRHFSLKTIKDFFYQFFFLLFLQKKGKQRHIFCR